MKQILILAVWLAVLQVFLALMYSNTNVYELLMHCHFRLVLIIILIPYWVLLETFITCFWRYKKDFCNVWVWCLRRKDLQKTGFCFAFFVRFFPLDFHHTMWIIINCGICWLLIINMPLFFRQLIMSMEDKVTQTALHHPVSYRVS